MPSGCLNLPEAFKEFLHPVFQLVKFNLLSLGFSWGIGGVKVVKSKIRSFNVFTKDWANPPW